MRNDLHASLNPKPLVAHSLPGPEHPNGVQLGGLGTGRIELGSNGRITLAGITNNWQRPLAGLEGAFFSIQSPDEGTFHLLQSEPLEGWPCAGVVYEGSHPVAQVFYSLPGSCLEVHLTAFSPMVPHDFPHSNIPGAVFLFRIKNPSSSPLRFRLAFSWENLLGIGGAGRRGLSLRSDRTGNAQRPWRSGGTCGISFVQGNLPGGPENARGGMVLAADPPDGATAWAYLHWNILHDRRRLLELLAGGGESSERFDGGRFESLEQVFRERAASPPAWDDPDPRFGGGRTGIEGAVHPAAVLGLTATAGARQCVDLPIVLAWHTPAHLTLDQPGADHGHAYEQRFSCAGEVASFLLAGHRDLLRRTSGTADWLRTTDLPLWLGRKCCNDLTALTTNSIVTRSGGLYTLEASPMMFGALGTMDQRMVSHPGYSLFYPDLNRTELESFARLQAAAGSIPHFNGNAHTAIGSADVEYGVTRWPDLACSFIIQCYRDWAGTGDRDFFERMIPCIRLAADWLMGADRDGDGVPEGGSSWDIEHYSGCFIATATLWMATLRILEVIETREGRADRAGHFSTRRHAVSETVAQMWTGTHYMKYRDPVSGETSGDIFAGQLVGEWVVRELGLAPVLPEAQVREALRTIYRMNGDRSRYRLMPIQVCPDGSLSGKKYSWHAWPQYTLVFVDCLALYLGLKSEAMASLEAFDNNVCKTNRTPWATTLWHDARTGRPDFEEFIGLDWYMNTPSTWWVLPALSGFAADEPSSTLTLGIPLAPGRWPVITPRYRGSLALSQDGGSWRLVFSADRIDRGKEISVQSVRWRGADTRLLINGRLNSGRAENGFVHYHLPEPLVLSPGGELSLEPVAGDTCP